MPALTVSSSLQASAVARRAAAQPVRCLARPSTATKKAAVPAKKEVQLNSTLAPSEWRKATRFPPFQACHVP